jgi:hypothetical protein
LYKLISKQDFEGLALHLKNTRFSIDVTKVFDKSGYTPLLYGAYKNITKACEIIVEFLLSDEEDTS